MKSKLAKKQNELNKKYNSDGLTDKILKEQIKINKLRNKHDIPDENEFLYDNYVQ